MVQFSLATTTIALSALSSMTLAAPLSSSHHYARDYEPYDLIARDYVDLATRDHCLEPELCLRSSPQLSHREAELSTRELDRGVPQELHRRAWRDLLQQHGATVFKHVASRAGGSGAQSGGSGFHAIFKHVQSHVGNFGGSGGGGNKGIKGEKGGGSGVDGSGNQGKKAKKGGGSGGGGNKGKGGEKGGGSGVDGSGNQGKKAKKGGGSGGGGNNENGGEKGGGSGGGDNNKKGGKKNKKGKNGGQDTSQEESNRAHDETPTDQTNSDEGGGHEHME